MSRPIYCINSIEKMDGFNGEYETHKNAKFDVDVKQKNIKTNLFLVSVFVSVPDRCLSF